MTFVIMQWTAFVVGVGMLVYLVVKKMHGASAPQISAMLFFPTAIILTSVFAANITSLKFGPDGIEFSLELAKKAAAEVVKREPVVAEALTARKGLDAVAAAQDRIASVKSWEELEKVMPFDLKDKSIVFYPKVNDRQVPVQVNARDSDAKSLSVEVLSKGSEWKQTSNPESRKAEKKY